MKDLSPLGREFLENIFSLNYCVLSRYVIWQNFPKLVRGSRPKYRNCLHPLPQIESKIFKNLKIFLINPIPYPILIQTLLGLNRRLKTYINFLKIYVYISYNFVQFFQNDWAVCAQCWWQWKNTGKGRWNPSMKATVEEWAKFVKITTIKWKHCDNPMRNRPTDSGTISRPKRTMFNNIWTIIHIKWIFFN